MRLAEHDWYTRVPRDEAGQWKVIHVHEEVKNAMKNSLQAYLNASLPDDVFTLMVLVQKDNITVKLILGVDLSMSMFDDNLT